MPQGKATKPLKIYWVEIIILFNPFIPEDFTKKPASQTIQVIKRIPVLIIVIQPDQSINKINGMLSGGDSN